MLFRGRKARKVISRGRSNGTGRRRAGAATVELTVCLPVLVLIVVGAIETCSFIHLNESLVTASYEGARVLSMPTSTREDGVRRCREFLGSRKIVQADFSTTPDDVESLEAGREFTVTVSVPLLTDSFIFSDQLMSERRIQKSTTFVKE